MSDTKNRRDEKFPVKIKRGSVEVKIYLTPSHGRDRYTLCYHQDGARKRPSFSTLQEAKTEAETVATYLGNADAAVLTLSSADRTAYLRAKQLLEPIGVPIEVAAAQFADAQTRLCGVPLSDAVDFYLKRHSQKIEPQPVQTVVDELLKVKQSDGLSSRYLQTLRWSMAKFKLTFKCSIGDVVGPDIDSWLRGLGLAPRTRNNLRNDVQTLFSFAKTRGYLPKDHDELAAVPRVKDGEGEIEIFTPNELQEILGCAGERVIPFLALGAFAGIRHAEVQRLEWQNIRFDDGIIEIRAAKAKTRSRRTVPILDNLREWLLPTRQNSGLVCSHKNVAYELHLIAKRINQERRSVWAKSNDVSEEMLKRTEQIARKQSKPTKRSGRQKGEVPPGGETAKIEGWQPFGWKHNALRHSFISYRVAQIKNVPQVALEAGNSPQIIHKNYLELVRPVDAQKWFAIVPNQSGNIIQLPQSDSRPSVQKAQAGHSES
jgi:integrase